MLLRHSLSHWRRPYWRARRRRRQRRSSPRNQSAPVRSIACGSGRSAPPRRRDASTISPCSKAIRRRSMWRWPPRASTRPPTPAPPSRRSSTTRAPARSARSRSRQRMPTSCGPVLAKRTTARARRGAMVSTSRRMAAGRGRTWACATASRSPASSSIPSTSTWSTSHPRATSGEPAASAAFTRPLTEELTWTRALHVDDDTGATDLVMDPLNNKTLYAATYQRRRQQWGMNGGGPGSGIWKSTDAGQTWAQDRDRDARQATRAASAWRFTAPIPTCFTPPSSMRAKAVCIAPTMRAPAGAS